MQYFFVDESGDPGLRNPKNSPYYIVAMAQLPNREPIAELAALRRELRLAPNFEFHFYQMNSEQKERFFRAIQVSSQYSGDEGTPSRRFPRKTGCAAQTFGTFPLFFEKIPIQPLSFRIRTAALIKSDVPLELRNLNSTELAMELLTNLTLRSSPLDIANDILVLDSVPETFLKSLRVHFTRAYKLERRERPFKKFVSSDSRHDDGLQLADMAAGAIRQYIWEDDSAYYQMFSRKVVDLWRVG